ncbi:MAG TPA: hypothetical protein VLK33_08855 [Terriglobales bacterium]|nr:hypothetical protein [Terriglobales bacterium]
MRPDELFFILHKDYRSDAVLHSELLMEFLFWGLALLLTWILVKTQPSFLLRLEKAAKRLSQRRHLTVGLIIFSALGLRVLLLIFVPIPTPRVHDEFSYLFQAATFASGRVTNPTPPGWEHLETFHINMVPTYHSMYPPAQAVFMAGAEIMHLSPWWGIWLATGLMCGAVCWMLQGWVPPQWALLGGAICVLRFATYSYWMNSYFGGSVAALGGALVAGALPRIRQTGHARYGVIFALGLGLLANSRPYEGLIFSIPFLCAIAWWLWTSRNELVAKIKALVPGAVFLCAVVASMGYYNWRCTGNARLFPYLLNQRTYHITRPFLWQERYPIPPYRHQVMRVFFIYHEMQDYYSRQFPGFFRLMMQERFKLYYDFYVWPLFVLIFIAAWVMMKKPKRRILPIAMLLLTLGLVIVQWPPEPHYGAPIVCVVLAIAVYGMRLAWTWWPKGKPFGPMLVRSICILITLCSLMSLGVKMDDPFYMASSSNDRAAWMPSDFHREVLQKTLESRPGRHILFVHLHRWETGAVFWIFNDPDLQNSKVIWAYDMGDKANQEFMRLYPGRQSWLVDKNDIYMPILPYGESGQQVEPLISDYRSSEPHGE